MRRIRSICRACTIPLASAVMATPLVALRSHNDMAYCDSYLQRPVSYVRRHDVTDQSSQIPRRHPRHISDFDAVYETIDLLGEGGFAEVWRVRHRATGEFRAAKLVKIEDTADLNRFNNEVEILDQLDNPLAARLIEYYAPVGQENIIREPTTGVIVYHIIEGIDLLDFINANIHDGKCISSTLLRDIAREMLRCLDYVHGKGIIHRDVKPENFILFVGKDGSVKLSLIDFGLADDGHNLSMKCYDKLKVGQSVYMAPETWKGQYSDKSDVWSVGVILLTIISEGAASLQSTAVDELNGASLVECINADLNLLSKKGVDPYTTSLLKKLLDVYPESRPSAVIALQDEWLT